jgi:hypothetical protein
MWWGCKHRVVPPNSLRGISPSSWPSADGRMHVEGHCEDCSKDVWRHALPDEDPPWRPQPASCGCTGANADARVR